MTDSHLRELERRFRASANAEDEAAWLRARVQAGELEPCKLELAGYLGHETAAAAAGAVPSLPEMDPSMWWRPPTPLGVWICGLSRWGHEPARDPAALLNPAWGNLVLPRAAVAIARCHDPFEDAEVALLAAEDYVHRPGRATSEEAGRQAQLQGGSGVPRRMARAVIAALHCAEPQLITTIAASRAASGCTLRDGKAGLDVPGWVAGNAAMGAAEELGDEAVRAAIQAELVPWLLGYADPVRLRVEARQR